MKDVHVCAACLATDVRMYSMSAASLLEPYRLLTRIELQSEGMPQKLCWECGALVNKFKMFRDKCERASLLLQDIYNQHDEVSVEEVLGVDRVKHNLISSYFSNHVNEEKIVSELRAREAKTAKLSDRDFGMKVERLMQEQQMEMMRERQNTEERKLLKKETRRKKESEPRSIGSMKDVRVCAACLATDVLMYSMSATSLLQTYRLLTGIELQSEGMPQKLCWECAALVHKFYMFRDKCERASLLLQDIYNQHDEVSVEEVLKVDREQHNLISPHSFCKTDFMFLTGF